jgi:hypothetical protein
MTTDDLLNQLTATKRQINELQSTYDDLLEQLTDAYEAGEVDSSFTHNDWSLTYFEGRRTYTYPPTVKALEDGLKAAKRLAEANGSAEPKTGAPFWTVRPPAQ